MEAIDKAKELVERFGGYKTDTGFIIVNIERAKQCALICVDEIFEAMSNPISFKYKFTKRQKQDWDLHRDKLNDYWELVKKEINKL